MHLSMALLLLASSTPAPFLEPDAVLLNLSEQSLNRIVVDSFHANGGPQVAGGRARVSSRVGDLRYRASLSDPVLRLGEDRTARLSLEVLDASLRIGRLERRSGGTGARCEGAGVDVHPARPLRVDLALDFAIEDRGLRIVPRRVEIPEVGERLLLVGPTRCSNSLFPAWLLWWVGKPFLRRSVDHLDQIVLDRARKSAAKLEGKEDLVKSGLGAELRLFPEVLDTRGGSLLVGLTASSAEVPARGAPPRALARRGSLPTESFLGISESLVNAVARRVLAGGRHFHSRRSGNARRVLQSDAIHALIPGLRKLPPGEPIALEVAFREAPRFEFGSAEDGQALIRVVVSGVDLELRRSEGGTTATVGTLHIDAGRMAVVPFANLLGGISFRVVENRWRTSSTGVEFDDELVAATLQEIAFGKVFETSYAPLWARDLRIGDTQFFPRSFAALEGYLVIGLGERPALAPEPASAAATRTESLLGSR